MKHGPSSYKHRLVAPCCPPRDARDAQRRQGAADYGLGRGDQAIGAWNREPLTEFEAKGADDSGQQNRVSDKELVAARQACAQLQQSNLDSATRIRVDHAESNLSDELQHRQATHH
jgi:hypothetical protein